MNGQLYGLYVDPGDGMEACAARCKQRLTELFAEGFNYDSNAFPYFDSVLMSDAFERFGLPFGTHSIIWDPDGRFEGRHDVCALGYDYGQIVYFLSEGMYQPKDNELLIGGFEQLIAGAGQPWAIREYSRKFCSFCEHIARMEGVRLKGLTGGYVVAEVSEGETLKEIRKIYSAKTGGICRVINSAE